MLYQVFHPAPYLMNLVILAAMLTYALKAKALRGAALEPTPTNAPAEASLDRNSGGAGFRPSLSDT